MKSSEKAPFRIQNSEFRIQNRARLPFCILRSEFCIPPPMSWTNVKLIFLREVRDQLRDRRTLFTILVLPLLLYPLMGMSVFQVQQFMKEHASKVRIVGTAALPSEPALIVDGKFATGLWSRDASLLELELIPRTTETLDELKAEAQRDIQLGLCDAVVVFPPVFAQRVAAFQQGASEQPKITEVPLIHNTASDRSKVAKQRIEEVLDRWRREMVAELRTAAGRLAGRRRLTGGALGAGTSRPPDHRCAAVPAARPGPTLLPPKR
jgi:hypothetical protein